MTNFEYIKRDLKKPIWLLLLLTILAGGEIYATFVLENRLTQQFMQEKRELDDLMHQVKFLQEQYQLFQQYGAQYQQLTQQGLAKEQDRVLWADMLLHEKQRRWLNPIVIQFEAQKKLEASVFQQLKIASPIFYQTRVNLTLGTQTDLDIFTTLEDIEQLISPFFLLKSCKIEMILGNKDKANIKFDSKQPNFSVICSLIFFNSKPSKFKGLSSVNSRSDPSDEVFMP